jgi:WD40 repeat protein
MPLRLEIKKELSNRSDRVKSVDIHPSADNPWVLSALYNGNVYIWDYSNNVSVLGVLDSGLFLLQILVDASTRIFFPF